MKKLLLSLAFLSLTSLGFAQKKADYSLVPSLVKEAKEKGNVKLANSLVQDYIDNYLLKLKLDQLMSKDNLLFISENLNTTDSKGFKLFFKQRSRINSVLGPDKAEYAIRKTIAKQFIREAEGQNSATVDWDAIECTITAKFGALGQEVVYGKRMSYYANVKDWSNFGRYYMLYFERALKRPEYHINNASWPLFENVNNPKVLKFACDVVMKYAITEWYQTDPNAYDTYAQLLYKTGNQDQAIEWEEKALKLAKGNEYLEKQLAVALEKMQRNEKTWKETIVNP
jgi:tetratricopeptide (TPR) repeat protein